jgi:hypothetical protein
VASVSGAHPDLGPELRQLAQTILDKLDPAVRLAAARATSGTPGRCEQVWCPVCALAALINGEQHPLLNVVAEHSVALLAVLRAMADVRSGGAGADVRSDGAGADVNPTPPAPDPSTPQGPQDDRPVPPPGPGRYQHIPINVDE